MTTRSNHNAATLLWVASLAIAAVCVWNTTPGLGWLDAGDFATASASLGVPHPTGFPLLTQLGTLVGLLPVGSLGTRTAWLSAVATGVAVWLLVDALFRGGSARAVPLALLVAAASLHGIATLNIHARTTEVYALSLLLGAALLRLVAAADERRDAPDLRLTALLGLTLGLGFAHHALFRLWAPAVVLIHLFQLPRELRARALAIGAFGAIAGGLANAYLVAAALRGGAHNWGDPSTLPALLRVLAGSEIREAFAGEMGGTSALGSHLREAARQLGGYAAIASAALLMLVGGLRGQREGIGGRAALRLAAVLVGLEVAYALLLNPMGLRDLQNLQWTALLLPLLGLAWLGRANLPDAPARLLLPIAALTLAALLWPRSDDRADGVRNDWGAEDLALLALELAPAEPVVLPASDSLIAATLFAKVAGDARPDAYLVGRSQASRGATLRYIDARQPFSLLAPGEGDRDLADLRPRFAEMVARAASQGHPVLWERLTRDSDLPATLQLTDCWPLAFAAGGGACSPHRRIEGNPSMDASFGRDARSGAGAALPPYRNWLAEQHGASGSSAAQVGDWPRALPSFAAAATLAPSSSRFSNLAVALANLGRAPQAFEALEAAWPLYPQSTKLCGNAAAFPGASTEVTAVWKARCGD